MCKKCTNWSGREKELVEIATVAKNAIVQIEGERKVEREIEYYNLDVVLAVGDQNIIKALREPKLLLHNFKGNTYVKGRFK